MFENAPKQELPTGKAKELSEFTQENWREHLLLFSQVKNKVIEVNPDVYTPLKLEEGKSSPLGLFAEAAFQEKPPQELPEGKQVLEFWPQHRRSALLGRVLFADREGRIYRDIDLKGVGYFTSGIEIEGGKQKEITKIRKPGEKLSTGGRFGLLDADIAAFDRQMSEEFLSAGIRTHRVLAIIELEEIILNGKKLSVEEARKANIIDEELNPVVEVRAFGIKTRVDDFTFGKKTSDLPLIEDAKKLLSQELGRKETLSNEEYAEWFTKTLGKNAGLMHKNGWGHNYSFSHNITLDCRIVDLDSVSELTEDNQREDLRDIKSTVATLMYWLSLNKREEDYFNLFMKSYNAVFPQNAREHYFAKMAKIKQKERTE